MHPFIALVAYTYLDAASVRVSTRQHSHATQPSHIFSLRVTGVTLDNNAADTRSVKTKTNKNKCGFLNGVDV